MTKPTALELWHQVVTDNNYELLDDLLDDHVVFHSPVVWSPQKGKFLAKMYLMAAAEVLGGDDFTYIREVVNDRNIILEFTQVIEGITINGVDMIELNNEGKIVDFKVMVRPLKAINKIHEKMGELLLKMSSK